MKKENLSLDARYLLNCAALLRYGNEKILIDGIFSDTQKFDLYSAKTEQDIFERENDFEGLKYLLFTHCHNDHYDRRKVKRILEGNKDIGILIPANNRMGEDFIKTLPNSEFRVNIMRGEIGALKKIELGDIKIEFMKTGHETFEYPEHFCLNILSPHENYLFTADMKLDGIPLLHNFTKREKSTIFINHLALCKEDWIGALKSLEYDNICFYHLPTAGRDCYSYRNIAMQYWGKYKNDFMMASLMEPQLWAVKKYD